VIRFSFDEFCIQHIPRHENCRAKDLTQGASGYNVQNKNFHVEAKPMLGGEKNLLYTEPDGLTATPTGLTATPTGLTATRCNQTAARANQAATQAGPTARTQGAAALRSRNWNMLKKIGGSRLLIICKIQARRSTKVFGVLLSSFL
jgi:hypothetical protein